MKIVPPLVDHTRYIRHAPARLRAVAKPARLRAVANMCGFARGYVAVCLLKAAMVRSSRNMGWAWGTGWLFEARRTPLLLTRQFQNQSKRRSY